MFCRLLVCLPNLACLAFNSPLWIAFMCPRPEPYLSMVLFLAPLHRRSATRTSYRPKRRYTLLAITPRDHCATVLLYISGIDDHPSPESAISHVSNDYGLTENCWRIGVCVKFLRGYRTSNDGLAYCSLVHEACPLRVSSLAL